MPYPDPISVTNVDKITPTRLYGPHNTFLTAVAISPDGQIMLSADFQGYLRIWDIETGTQLLQQRIFTNAVQQIVFGQADEGYYRFCVIANQHNIKTLLLDPTHNLTTQHDITEENYTLLHATFSPDNRPVVACVNAADSDDPRLYLLYGDDKSLLSAYRSGNTSNPNASFNADGTLVAVGQDDGTVSIRGARKDGSTRQRIATGFRGVKRTIFSPDSTKIAAIEGMGDRIGVYDVSSGEPIGNIMTLPLPNDFVFGGDGNLLVVTTNQKGGLLTIFDTHTGDAIRRVKGSSPLAFHPAGYSLACGNNYAIYSKSVMLWDERESPDGILSKVLAPVDALAAETNIIRQLAVLTIHQKPVRAMAFHPDNSILATGGDDHHIHLWSMETGGDTGVLYGHSADITGLAFSPDGRTLASCSGYYSSSDDNTVRLWDMDEATQQFEFQKHQSRVVAVYFMADGQRLVSAETNGVVLLWNAADGDVSQRIETPTVINHIALSPNGALVATTHGSETALKDTTVRLWNVQTGEQLHEIVKLNDWVLRTTFSPDGNVLMVADYSGRVCGWDVTNGELIHDLTGGFDLTYNPQQDVIAIAQDKTVRLTSLADNSALMTLRHGANVTHMAFANEGDLLAVGTKNGDIAIWGVSKTSSKRANTIQIEKERLERVRSGRHTLQLLELTCKQAQENDGDETYIRLDGQTIWSIEGAGRKMHHIPNRSREVDIFDFKQCRMRGPNGWQQTGQYMPSDFQITGLTGPIVLELWEADSFLRGGDDYLGKLTISPTKAGQGPQEHVFYVDGVNYVLSYEILFE
jgi:WD40 repeat protein